jgi:acetyl-CoA carboxylase biotin carboxyl carrier protein
MTDTRPKPSNTIPAKAWPQIAAWLAEADVDCIELQTGAVVLRMVRGSQGYQLQTADASASAPSFSPASPLAVTAQVAGIFLTRHPAGGGKFPAQGDHVQAGELLALLQIGLVLTPVLAPVNGTLGRCLQASGTQVGYGARLIELLAGDA